LGLLPAIIFCLVPWAKRSWRDGSLAKLKYGVGALVVCVAVLLPIWGNILSLGRAHRELRMTLTPINYVSAVSSYWRQEARKRAKVIVSSYGEDAHQFASGITRKSLFVIVVGETARADHFALNGYGRPTNPELSKVPDLINYPAAYSCGTDTAQS